MISCISSNSSNACARQPIKEAPAALAPVVPARTVAASGPARKSFAMNARQIALSCAMLAVTVALISQTSFVAPARLKSPDKSIARIDAGAPPETRQLVYYPEDLALLTSLRSFTPIKAWPTTPPADAGDKPLLAQAKPHAASPEKAVFTRMADVTPPPRPRSFAPSPPFSAQAVASVIAAKDIEKKPTGKAARKPDDRLVIAGVALPRFIPTGADIMRRLGGFRDSIGDFIHVSSR